MIAVIDYKAGNLTSVMKALGSVSADCLATEDPDVVRGADKIVLPGVGHFAATTFLDEHGLTDAVREQTAAGVPFLGICVGLQWLFQGSTESPGTAGLGIFPGECERFGTSRACERPRVTAKCPHVGWNSLTLARTSALTFGIADGAFVYYTHSYRGPVVEDTVATTDYGGAFTAIVERGNIMGVQFHPEKSGETGLQLLRNFVGLGC